MTIGDLKKQLEDYADDLGVVIKIRNQIDHNTVLKMQASAKLVAYETIADGYIEIYGEVGE